MKEVILILSNQLFSHHSLGDRGGSYQLNNKDLNFRLIKKEVKYEDRYYYIFSDRKY
jgi:hypothetical protein